MLIMYYVHRPGDNFAVFGDPQYVLPVGAKYFAKDIYQLPQCESNEMLKMTVDGDFYCEPFEQQEN